MRFLALVVLVLCNQSLATQLCFNIGGKKIETTALTIEQSGSSRLISLMDDAPKLDSNGCIVLDRPSMEGEILDFCIRHLPVPRGFDRDLVQATADYYGMSALKEMPPRRLGYTAFFPGSKIICDECGATIRPGSMAKLLKHLQTEHKAEIKDFADHWDKRLPSQVNYWLLE